MEVWREETLQCEGQTGGGAVSNWRTIYLNGMTELCCSRGACVIVAGNAFTLCRASNQIVIYFLIFGNFLCGRMLG